MKLTTEQVLRLNSVVDAWNGVRHVSRPRATGDEVLNFMLQQEEISIEAMQAAELDELAAELGREDLTDGDERKLPPIILKPELI